MRMRRDGNRRRETDTLSYTGTGMKTQRKREMGPEKATEREREKKRDERNSGLKKEKKKIEN